MRRADQAMPRTTIDPGNPCMASYRRAFGRNGQSEIEGGAILAQRKPLTPDSHYSLNNLYGFEMLRLSKNGTDPFSQLTRFRQRAM